MEFEQYCIATRDETKEYMQFLREMGYSGAGLENNAYARHDRFLREFMPRIAEVLTYSERGVIEIGCGVGSVTHAFADLFAKVQAFEISQNLVDAGKHRASLFGLSNLDFYLSSPDQIVDQALEHLVKDTVVVLYAVLEHMTEQERIKTLEKIWSAVDEDNFIYVGNTPNRLSYQDEHTHAVPFLLGLPDYTIYRYLQMNPSVQFSEHLVPLYERGEVELFSLTRKRRGLGISFHDFEIAFGGFDLNECVVLGDIGKPWRFHDALLSAFFYEANIDVPMCFAMRDMNFMLKKTGARERKSIAKNNALCRAENKKIVSQVLNSFGNK